MSRVNGTSVTTTTDWDTSSYDAPPYAIYVELVASTGTVLELGPARGYDRRDSSSLTFTQPTENTTFTQGGDALTIGWSGHGSRRRRARVTIGLDPDDDPESGNEIFIHEDTLTAEEAEDTVAWTGNDLLGGAVAVGGLRALRAG